MSARVTDCAVVALAACLVGLLGACGSDSESPGAGPRPLTLALDFSPNAAHAGVYAAVEQGEDEARGIDLAVRAPSASTDSLRLLDSGRAELAVVDIHDLGLARERGADVVGVGALVQRPLAAVLAGPAIERPRELAGRRVGVTGLPSDDAVLRSIVAGDGGDPARVRKVTIGFSAVPDLIAGNVDAATAFWNAEGVALRERGFSPNEFRVDDYGAPTYPELVLAVTRETLARDRDAVEATLAAIGAGTRSALAEPGPVVEAIARASAADESLVDAQLEAIAPALDPTLALDRRTLARWGRFDARFGILERPPDVEAAFALDLGPAG